MAHQAWPGTTTGYSKHSSESISESEQAEESEDEQRATEDDEEHEDEGDGDDECQGGVLGHRGSRSCHLNLSTPIPVDSTAILLLKDTLLNSTSNLDGHRSFRVETDCRAGGGGGGGLGGREGGGPSVLRLENDSIAAGLPTWRRSWRPSDAAGRCFRGRRGGRGDPPASPSGTDGGGDPDGAPGWGAPLAWRRRRRRGRGADAGVEEDGAGSLSRSTSRFALVLPSLTKMVSDAVPPASLIC